MQIIFTTNNMPLSVLIRTITSCKWHHVGVIVGGFVIEARFDGVTKTPIDEFKSRGKYSIENHPLADEQKANDFALMQVGKKYDIAGLVSFPFRKDWQDDNKWYCSELVASIAEVGGSPIVRSDLKGISPRDLWVSTKV